MRNLLIFGLKLLLLGWRFIVLSRWRRDRRKSSGNQRDEGVVDGGEGLARVKKAARLPLYDRINGLSCLYEGKGSEDTRRYSGAESLEEVETQLFVAALLQTLQSGGCWWGG